MKHPILSAVLALGASAASAQMTDGNNLWEVCSGPARTDQAFCTGYVAGMMEIGIFTAVTATADDGGDMATTLENIQDFLGYCTPPNVYLPQIVEVFKSYLENSPARSHLPGNVLYTEAMQEAFPCK